MIFLFLNLSISVLHLIKFRLTSKNGLFLPVFSHFHTKIMLAYSCFIVMWLFSLILVPGELFLIHFQRYVLTGSLNPQIPLWFPVKTENHWLCMQVSCGLSDLSWCPYIAILLYVIEIVI